MTKNVQKNMNRGVERVAGMYQPYVSRTLVLLAVLLAMSVFLYSAFLLEAVAHAASKTSAESQAQKISEHLSTLESQYLALTQAITPEKAAQLGFVTPPMVASVYAKGGAGTLSFQGR